MTTANNRITNGLAKAAPLRFASFASRFLICGLNESEQSVNF
jgi:hypothetical protein